MNKSQAIEIYEMIITMYPKFNSGESTESRKRFAVTWINQIMRGDYKRTKEKLENHLIESVYPPKLADFIILPKKEHSHNAEVDLIEKWESDVRKEMSDPELRKKREETFKKMRDKYKEMFGSDNID